MKRLIKQIKNHKFILSGGLSALALSTLFCSKRFRKATLNKIHFPKKHYAEIVAKELKETEKRSKNANQRRDV